MRSCWDDDQTGDAVPAALRSLRSGDTVDAVWLPADPLLADEIRRQFITQVMKAGKPCTFSASMVAGLLRITIPADVLKAAGKAL